MKILSINAGSSSLKFTLFEMKDESVIASGIYERIGLEGTNYTIKYNGQKINEEVEVTNHEEAVRNLIGKLMDLEIIKSLEEIKGVGHRIAHGLDKYSESVIITDKVIEDIESTKEFAPLHVPGILKGIHAFR